MLPSIRRIVWRNCTGSGMAVRNHPVGGTTTSPAR